MEQTTPPFGDDLFPALQKLSDFLEPHVKPVVLATIGFSLPYALSNSHASISPQAVVPLQLLAVAYLSGLWKLPNFLNSFTAEHSESLQALYVISNSLGTYFKVGFLVSLTCYLPIYYDVPLPFQPWLQGLILVVISVAGFFAPTAKFVGPVRFGYLYHATHLSSIYRLMLDWWVYAVLLLIFSPVILPSLGLGAMSVAAWIHVYREYVRQHAAVAEAVERHAASAAIAASAAREDAAAAGRFQEQVAAAATAARHDAVQALLVRPTDFFDSATIAWAALNRVKQITKHAETCALAVTDAVSEISGCRLPPTTSGSTRPDEKEDSGKPVEEDSRKPSDENSEKPEDEDSKEPDDEDPGAFDEEESDGDGRMEALNTAAQNTIKELHRVLEQLRTAQEAVQRSQKAAEENKKAREMAKKDAKAAVETMQRLAEVVSKWPTIAFTASSAAADTRAYADRALAAATEGEMEKAWEIAALAETSANKAKEAMEKLRSEVGNGQQEFICWLKSWE